MPNNTDNNTDNTNNTNTNPMVNIDDLSVKESELLTHPNQELLTKLINISDPIYIHGPTGSGKTVGTSIASLKLKLPFYKKLIGAQMTEASILGYMDATGKYVPGIAFKPFTEGGILLLDEIDNGNSNTNLVVNALADREINFPLGMYHAHKNFRLIVTANTIGTGANISYVGRNRQDVALTSRFVFLEWNYDGAFEQQIVTQAYKTAGGQDINKLYGIYYDFLKLREAARQLNIHHILSPRTAVYMARQIAAEIPQKVLFNSVIRRGLDKEATTQIYEKARTITVECFGEMAEHLNKQSSKEEGIIVDKKSINNLFVNDPFNKKPAPPKNPFENDGDDD